MVYLSWPQAAALHEFLRQVKSSRNLHRGWVCPPGNAAAFAEYIQRQTHSDFESYWVRRREDDALVGVFNVSQIVRGAFKSAYLGYYAFAALSGRGYMSAGLRLVLRQIFKNLGLHRIEANIQPNNLASRRLVQKHGFRQEGYSPRYLKIGGRWQDHERWALLSEDWRKLS